MIAVYKIFFFLINEVVVIIFKRFKFIRKILNRNELLWRRLVEITTAQFPFLWRPLENGATLEGSKNTTTNQQLVCVCVFVSLVLCVRCMTVSVVRLFFFFVFLFHVKSYVLYRFFLFVVMISFWFFIYICSAMICVCARKGEWIDDDDYLFPLNKMKNLVYSVISSLAGKREKKVGSVCRRRGLTAGCPNTQTFFFFFFFFFFLFLIITFFFFLPAPHCPSYVV